MRYVVIHRHVEGPIQFVKSFTDGVIAVDCANDRLTRANINAAFVVDDLKFIDALGSLVAKNDSGTIKVTIMTENEWPCYS